VKQIRLAPFAVLGALALAACAAPPETTTTTTTTEQTTTSQAPGPPQVGMVPSSPGSVTTQSTSSPSTP